MANFKYLGTHGIQFENNDELGMVVLVPENESGKIGRTTNVNYANKGYVTVPEKWFSNVISETSYIGQKCKSNVLAKHYFFSVWELEKDQWKTEVGFRKYISAEAEKLSLAIEVY